LKKIAGLNDLRTVTIAAARSPSQTHQTTLPEGGWGGQSINGQGATRGLGITVHHLYFESSETLKE
jgi:hypothetical protein